MFDQGRRRTVLNGSAPASACGKTLTGYNEKDVKRRAGRIQAFILGTYGKDIAYYRNLW